MITPQFAIHNFACLNIQHPQDSVKHFMLNIGIFFAMVAKRVLRCYITKTMEKNLLKQLLLEAFARRTALIAGDVQHRGPWRVCNGFTEGLPDLAIDLMGRTAVIHDYSHAGYDRNVLTGLLLKQFDFLQAVLCKKRHAADPAERNGKLIYGEKPDSFVVEHNVRYAIDLMMNHDNGFYSDTRNLRKYLLDNMQGKSVLNTFAYTGSLGIAAAAGGAGFVLQSDLSNKFLQTAYRSASLNGLTFTKKNFKFGDFFPVVAALRKARAKFDCVIVDPPFFSRTDKGTVDLANDPLAVINKVRPLVADNGLLIAVNNSLYLSGRELINQLNDLCRDGYLQLENLIAIPEDFCCSTGDKSMPYPADPEPFNHPTKIAVLRVHVK